MTEMASEHKNFPKAIRIFVILDRLLDWVFSDDNEAP